MRCKTYTELNILNKIKSSVTNRTYEVINHTGEHLNCHVKNLIYSLTCNFCSAHYAGKTASLLNIRMDFHRNAKSGCEHIIYHFKCFCISHRFSYQILQKLSRTSYNQSAELKNSLTQIRLKREREWALKL